MEQIRIYFGTISVCTNRVYFFGDVVWGFRRLNMEVFIMKNLTKEEIIKTLNSMEFRDIIDVWNEFAYAIDSALVVYENTYEVINEIFTCAYDAVEATNNNKYLLTDMYFTLNVYESKPKMHSFTCLIEDDCPIQLDTLAEWIITTENWKLLG